MVEDDVRKCPKCGERMEIGFLAGAPHWVRGRSYWTFSRGDRVFGYRCVGCGYVEFYAEFTNRKQGVPQESGPRMVRD